MEGEKAHKGSLLCWASEIDVETDWRTAKAHTGVAMLNRAPEVVDAETIGTDNSVHSSKYTWLSFLPKGLFEQFRRVANIYFLFISFLMILGQFTSLLPYNLSSFTTLFPLAVILACTLLKEGLEDKKRHEDDAETNMRTAQVLQPSDGKNPMPTYTPYSWKDLRVGMVVKIDDRMEIPADVVPLMSSESGGRCYIETANIDGETNLKLKQCAKTAKDGGVIWESEAELSGVSGLAAEFEPPNPAIHQFKGNLTLEGTGAESNAEFRKIPLSEHQMLLRGAILRNTKWVLGVVVYTGAESKLVLNSREAPSKLSTVEAQVNSMIYFIFCCHALLSLVSTCFHAAWTSAYNEDLWYICNEGAFEDSSNVLLRENCDPSSSSYSNVSYFFNFVVVFNNFIPISLYVTVEFVNLCQAYFINKDKEMYDEGTDTPGLARTSNMNGDLGQIEYIFSDKTGTLTCNEMKFRSSSVGGVIFGHPQGDKELTMMQDGGEATVRIDGNKVRSLDALANLAKDTPSSGDYVSRAAKSFAEVMSVCHTVIVEKDKETGSMTYQAESPDEEALVSGAKRVGWMYTDKTTSSVIVRCNGGEKRYKVLALIEFNSTRKRMSTVVQCPDGTYKLLMKGADNIMFDRTATDGFALCGDSNAQGRDTVTRHLEFFSTQGLRTLVLGEKILTQAEAEAWTAEWHASCSSTTDRSHLMDLAAAKIEFGVTVVGCTAIEDRLQDDVPQTIADLRVAGVKVWVLTGDKMETAINIGYSARLLTPEMSKVIIRAEQDPDSTVAPLSIAEQLNQAVSNLAKQNVDFEPLATGQTWLHKMFGVNEPNYNDFEVGGVENTTNFDGTQLKPDNLAMVVDGPSLIEILKDDKLRRNLLRVGCCCRAVLACRVSPKQKQMIVKLVKEGLMSMPITLAIGDGANDVGMIQEAQIGIGISGKEGRQAVNNSDFAIAQFRFLKRLMIVHGRWNYRRISATVIYSFYKNIVLTIILFYYQFMCFFSGVVLFEEWVYTAFNGILFLGPLFLGMFDQDLSDEASMKYTKVYSSGRLKQDLNVKVMAWSFVRAYLDATLIYFCCHIAVNGRDWNNASAWGANGDPVDMLVFGTTVYTVMIVGMLTKLSIMHHTWNKFTICGMVITIAGFLLFLMIYQTSAGAVLHGGNYLNVTNQMFALAPFWLLCFMTPGVNSLFDMLIEAIRSNFFGDHVDLVRQADHKGGLETLRPFLIGTPRPDGIDVSLLTAVELHQMMSPGTPHRRLESSTV